MPAKRRLIYEQLPGTTLRGWEIREYLGYDGMNHRLRAVCPVCKEVCVRIPAQLRQGAACLDCARARAAMKGKSQKAYLPKSEAKPVSPAGLKRQQAAYRKIMLDLPTQQAYFTHAVACRRNAQQPQMPAEWLAEYEAVMAHPEEAPRFPEPIGPTWPSTLTWAMGERD